jgi:hypothetical protein
LIRLVIMPGPRISGEPGIHNPGLWLWIPGSRARSQVYAGCVNLPALRAPRNDSRWIASNRQSHNTRCDQYCTDNMAQIRAVLCRESRRPTNAYEQRVPSTGRGENCAGQMRTAKSRAASHCRSSLACSRGSNEPIRRQYERHRRNKLENPGGLGRVRWRPRSPCGLGPLRKHPPFQTHKYKC